MLIDRSGSCLMIVDVQQRLLGAMDAPRQVLAGCTLLMKAADRLEIPVIVTEQYPEGLGPTVEQLAELADDDAIYSKVHFSAARNSAIRSRIEQLAPGSIVIAGIEAHICVLQSATVFAEAGYRCYVVADATSSRLPSNHAAAMQRLRDAGVEIVTSEMVVYERMEQAGTAEFRDLLTLLK